MIHVVSLELYMYHPLYSDTWTSRRCIIPSIDVLTVSIKVLLMFIHRVISSITCSYTCYTCIH